MDSDRLAKKYRGRMSDTYDAERVGTRQWEAENRIVMEYLSGFPAGTSVLDVPVGTGRFLALYDGCRFKATAIDISTAMLEQAKQKVSELSSPATLQVGSIFSLEFPGKVFDVAVCVRFMNWVGKEDFRSALSELVRVARRAIILDVATYTPLSAIGLPSPRGFTRLLRQLKLRFYRFRKGSAWTIHERAEVLRQFAGLDLKIVDKKSKDQSTRNWRRGYERDIYLLEIGYRKMASGRCKVLPSTEIDGLYVQWERSRPSWCPRKAMSSAKIS